MFARVSKFTASEGRLEDGLVYERKVLAPRLEKQPGFEGVMLMMDRETGFAYNISFWKTAEDLAGSRELGASEAGMAAAMFEVDVEVGNCEVVFSTFPTFAV